MAYLAIPDEWLESGKPTKEEIFQYIKDNQESFNTDIEALKQTSTIDIFDVSFDGSFLGYEESELNDRCPVYRAPVSGTITSVVVTLTASAGASGALQVDIEKSTDNGANWSPILSSPVEITATAAGSVSGAVNFVDVASQSFDQNDMLRIRIDSIKPAQNGFHVSVYGEVS